MSAPLRPIPATTPPGVAADGRAPSPHRSAVAPLLCASALTRLTWAAGALLCLWAVTLWALA